MKTCKTTILSAIALFSVLSFCSGQGYQTIVPEKSDFQWPEGKKMALSLTFDDARLSQIDNGIPLFDKFGTR